MNPRALAVEYWGKGLAVALLGYVAIETLYGSATPAYWHLAAFYLPTLAGLTILLGLATFQHLRAGHAIGGRWLAFGVFLLLENSFSVYLGILGGMLVGAVLATYLAGWDWLHLPVAIVAGLAVGEAFAFLQRLNNRWLRGGTILLVLVALAAGFLFWVKWQPDLLTGPQQTFLIIHLFLAIPVVYLLALAGRSEETEVEIGCVCIALGIALTLLFPPAMQAAGVFLAIALYVLYVRRVLKHVQVFKHVLRGMSHLEAGRHRAALLAYRRALELNPADRLAQEGQWQVHKRLDFNQVADDHRWMPLINLDLCLQRVGDLLLAPGPGPEKLAEARKLLDLVKRQRPALTPVVQYWQAVASVHEKDFPAAEERLRGLLLKPAENEDQEKEREAMLVPAWQLALVQHPRLRRELGQPLLDQEGQRLAAVAAVERRLRVDANDAAAWELKRLLYAGVTEEEAEGRFPSRADDAAGAITPDFDPDYCAQLGQSLLEDAVQWRRGAELLRIAALASPARAPLLLASVGEACERVGDEEGARLHFQRMREAARALGVKRMPEDDRARFLATVKRLGEKAHAVGDVDGAIEYLSIYAESGASGQETPRLLARLHEQKGNVLEALLFNERALLYAPADKELLERKDSYYYSLASAVLGERIEQARSLFDVAYCLRKARTLLDLRGGGPEHVDWAAHLVELARTVEPQNLQAMTLAARVLLRRGRQLDAVPILEEARQAGENGFASADEEEAWYVANRLLGDLYLQACHRPDQALECYSQYRKSSKSGVDTLYKMGQAYEMLGDRARAVKCYQNVVAYDHPLAPDARAALYRLDAPVP